MVACLTVYSRHQPTVRRFLDQDREYLLGRSADCDLRFDDPSLSRSHARLRHANDGWELEDLGSKNGVRINGTGVRKAGLADGAWLSLGDLLARFELVSDDYEAEAERRGAALWETSMQLSRTLRPELGLDGLLARLLDSALELAGTERGFVMLGDDGAVGQDFEAGDRGLGLLRVWRPRRLAHGDLRERVDPSECGRLSAVWT